MSLAPNFPTAAELSQSPTWRRFRTSVLVAGAALAVGCIVYLVEKYLVRPERRFLENPSEMTLRVFGVAHFLVGWFYLFTARRTWMPRNLLSLATWTAIGVGAAWGFAAGGGMKNPLLVLGFYTLFLIHDLRDQGRLFSRSGEAPDDGPEARRFLDDLTAAVIALAVTLLGAIHLVHGLLLRNLPVLAEIGAMRLGAAWACLVGLTGFLWVRAIRQGRVSFGSWQAAAELHAPLLQVHQGLLLVLVVGSMLGSVGLNLVILLHVTTWLVFTWEDLGRRHLGPGASRWTRLRNSPTFFLVLHLGLAAVVLVLAALRVHAWERSGWFCQALATSSFPLWSLLHICMAFARR